jgi:hypothetical protein
MKERWLYPVGALAAMTLLLAGCVPAELVPASTAAAPAVTSGLALQKLVDVVRQKHPFPSGFVYRMEGDKAVQAWEISGGPLAEISPEAAEAKAAASWDCLPSGRLRGGSSGSIRLYSPTKAVAVVGVMSDTGLFQQIMELTRVGEQWQVLSDREEHFELLPGCGSAPKSPTPPMVEATLASAMRTIVVAPISTPGFWPTGMPTPTPALAAVKLPFPEDEVTCGKEGGTWRPKMLPNCTWCEVLIPTTDGGKLCWDVSECQGSCNPNLTAAALQELEKLLGSGDPLPLMIGTCSAYLRGCGGIGWSLHDGKPEYRPPYE